MKLALAVSPTASAQEAEAELRPRHDWVPWREADVLVALGGDGFMLDTLHKLLAADLGTPVYGMNRGTIGFLMNHWSASALEERLRLAKSFHLSPLCMEARDVNGEVVTSPAINEVSLLRETRQAAKIQISIDGKIRLAELACDGVLVATPAGSTAYNLSANGPILPLSSDLLALTPLSPFRPRRWRGALIPNSSDVHFRILEPDKRPVSAVADQIEVRDVREVRVTTDATQRLTMLFDPDYALDDRIFMEQFLS